MELSHLLFLGKAQQQVASVVLIGDLLMLVIIAPSTHSAVSVPFPWPTIGAYG